MVITGFQNHQSRRAQTKQWDKSGAKNQLPLRITGNPPKKRGLDVYAGVWDLQTTSDLRSHDS